MKNSPISPLVCGFPSWAKCLIRSFMRPGRPPGPRLGEAAAPSRRLEGFSAEPPPGGRGGLPHIVCIFSCASMAVSNILMRCTEVALAYSRTCCIMVFCLTASKALWIDGSFLVCWKRLVRCWSGICIRSLRVCSDTHFCDNQACARNGRYQWFSDLFLLYQAGREE